MRVTPVRVPFIYCLRNDKEVVMITLRALTGAYSALAFLGFTIFPPLIWIVILIAASTATP